MYAKVVQRHLHSRTFRITAKCVRSHSSRSCGIYSANANVLRSLRSKKEMALAHFDEKSFYFRRKHVEI